MTRSIKLLLALSMCLTVTACGTDTGSGERAEADFDDSATRGVTVTTSGGSVPERSGFSLRLTDAPVEGLAKVVVSFAAVEIKRKDGGWIRYTLPAPQPVDLLQLQGLATADLLIGMPIEPGEYKQLRFIVDDTPMANHVMEKTGGMVNLIVPRGGTRGIKLKHDFTIPADRQIDFTVDFDLRQSVKLKKSGDYKLKPKMRMVADDEVGFIRGTVGAAFLLGPGCSDADPDTHNAVYIYRGHDASIRDIDFEADDDEDESSAPSGPLTTTSIFYDPKSGSYIFEAAFLPAGDYTIAITCAADLDDLDEDDTLPILHRQNVTVMVSDKTFLRP